jgi:hypothetical protein
MSRTSVTLSLCSGLGNKSSLWRFMRPVVGVRKIKTRRRNSLCFSDRMLHLNMIERICAKFGMGGFHFILMGEFNLIYYHYILRYEQNEFNTFFFKKLINQKYQRIQNSDLTKINTYYFKHFSMC